MKQIAAILYRNPDDFRRALELLVASFSAIDYQGTCFPFSETDYYEKEMGSGLTRLLISFETLVEPDCLVEAKVTAKRLEKQLSNQGNRTVNLDIGYLDMFKLILASCKARSNKIYMGNQIWADMILYFEKGNFQPFPWSFPDFKSGLYNNDLKAIRTIYKQQLKKRRSDRDQSSRSKRDA